MVKKGAEQIKVAGKQVVTLAESGNKYRVSFR